MIEKSDLPLLIWNIFDQYINKKLKQTKLQKQWLQKSIVHPRSIISRVFLYLISCSSLGLCGTHTPRSQSPKLTK